MDRGDAVYLIALVCIAVPAVVIRTVVKSNLAWTVKVLRNVIVENPGTASAESYLVKYVPDSPGLFYGLARPYAGLLTLKPEEIVFVGYNRREMPVRISLRPNTLKDVSWIGRFNAISREQWFVLNNGEGSHYFAAVGAKTRGNSRTESQMLFQRITSLYAPDNEE